MYFNFQYVTDPPADELVNPVTQLNANWQDVNDKIKTFQTIPNTIVAPPKGTEAFYPETPTTDKHRIAVYDGVNWRRGLSHSSSVSAWQTVTLRAPFVARVGYTPVAKVYPNQGYVLFAGGVQNTSSAVAWDTTQSFEITSDTALDSTITPVNGGFSYCQGAAAQVTGAGAFAGALIWAQAETTPAARVAIRVRYQGDAGGGNFVMLDGLKWWFR